MNKGIKQTGAFSFFDEYGHIFNIKFFFNKDGYVGICKEYPGAMSQGKTMEDLKVNMIDSVRMIRIDDK
jgi:predicted RNase H-like HicB family nuclease